MEISRTLIKTVPFSELNLWDVKRFNYIFNQTFDNAVFLKDILKPFKQRVSKEEMIENNWQIIAKINFSGELFLRDKEQINTYKGSLNKVPDNSIIYSKINVRHGCLYYHEKGMTPFAVSTEYPTFVFDDKKVNGYYLKRVLRSDEFKKLLNTKTSGISKARVKVHEFLEIKIPLPPIEEQNEIVAIYDKKLALAKSQKQQSQQLEQQIENYLFDVLGIKKIKEEEAKKGMQLVNFKETSRWDTMFLIGNIAKLQANYPIEKFSNSIEFFNKGENGKSIRINSIQYPNDDFHYIGMENIEKETGRLLELNKVKGKQIKSQTLRIPKGFLIYGKLRPYLNKYWINDISLDDIICSSEFFVFKVKKEINPYFFKIIMSSAFIQSQITDKTSGARMPRINEDIFMNLQYPLPLIEIQQEIAKHISNLKGQIKNLNKEALTNSENAIKEFEQEIFNNE